MERSDRSWTDVLVPDVEVSDLCPEAVMSFRNRGVRAGRLSREDAELDHGSLLERLNLVDDGIPTRAAVLLFHSSPKEVLGPVSLKIGMFDGPNLLYQDELDGPLIITASSVMDILMTKYTVKPVSYDGIYRVESSPYPEPALREAVMNAIVHNDYSSHVPIQIKVSGEGVTVYNEGGLPPGWTLDRLMGQHKSLPRNPLLATAFFRAGLIGSFGRGIGKIMSQFEGRHEFDPVFECDSGFSVTFKNELRTFQAAPDADAAPEDRVVAYLRGHGPATYADIAAGTGQSLRSVQRVAKQLSDRGAVTKTKRGREVVLTLVRGAS